MGFFSSVGKVVGKVAAPIGAAVGGIFGGPAGASIGGSAGAALSGYLSQEETNQANSAQAQRAMNFSERMSNTSWQRGMADMRAAGLNPIFAYKTGGASTPVGSQATMVNPMTAAGDVLSKTSSSAVALSQNKRQMKLLEQKAQLANQQKAHVSAQTGLAGQTEDLYRANTQKVQEEVNTAKAIATAEKWKSKLIERDIKYKLANPTLMKTKEWGDFVNTILGNTPVLGKTIK